MDRRQVLLLSSLSVIGFSSVGGTTAAVAQAADTVVIAQAADAYSMDPAKHSAYPTANILFNIFDPLVTLGADGKFQPALALSWSNPDPNTWRFKLREGIKFHNGEA